MLPTSGGYADAVIVAAGASSRMGGTDKSQAPIEGRPALRWAVDAMRGAAAVRRIIVVTAAERLTELRAQPWMRESDVSVVTGGARRQDSVACGVRAADAEVVLVHDAARPLATSALADRVAAGCRHPRRRDPGDARARLAQAGHERAGDRRPPTARPCSGRRPRRAHGASCCRPPSTPGRTDRSCSATSRRCWRATACPWSPCPASRPRSRSPSRPTSTWSGRWPGRPLRHRSRAAAGALRLGHGQPSLRQPRRPASGRPGHPGGAPAAWALRRRCRAARGL